MNFFIKKISAFVMLFAAAVPFAFILFVHIKQQAIRHQMKESLEHQLLRTITLSESEINWVKPGKEILIDGEMFDIKSHTKVNELHKFTGLLDHEETVLLNHLKNNTGKNNDAERSLLTNIFHWLQSIYPNNTADQVLPYELNDLHFYFLTIQILSPEKKIPTPPPQV